MNTYKQIYLLGFKKNFQYRMNFYLGLLSVFFPLAIQYFLWKGMYGSSDNDNLFGYQLYQMLEYAIFACLISKLIQASFAYDINSDIKEGGLAKYLVKPISYFKYQFFCFIGEKTAIIFTAAILLVGIWFGFDIYMGNSLNIKILILFFVALLFAMVLNFLILFCVGCIGFWMIDAGGAIFIFMLVGNIVSGGIFPLDIFGPTVQNILKLLPFGYTNYFCTSIICNRFRL